MEKARFKFIELELDRKQGLVLISKFLGHDDNGYLDGIDTLYLDMILELKNSLDNIEVSFVSRPERVRQLPIIVDYFKEICGSVKFFLGFLDKYFKDSRFSEFKGNISRFILSEVDKALVWIKRSDLESYKKVITEIKLNLDDILSNSLPSFPSKLIDTRYLGLVDVLTYRTISGEFKYYIMLGSDNGFKKSSWSGVVSIDFESQKKITELLGLRFAKLHSPSKKVLSQTIKLSSSESLIPKFFNITDLPQDPKELIVIIDELLDYVIDLSLILDKINVEGKVKNSKLSSSLCKREFTISSIIKILNLEFKDKYSSTNQEEIDLSIDRFTKKNNIFGSLLDKFCNYK